VSVDIEELAAHLDQARLKDVKAQYEARATNATAAFLLCFFLGYLGAHRFYVGQWRAGLLRLTPFILGAASVVAGFLTAAPLNAALFVIGGVLVLASLIWEIVDLGRMDKEIHQRNTLLAEGLIAGALLSDPAPIEEAAHKLDDVVHAAAAQSLAAGATPAASAAPAGMITADDLAEARALAEQSGQAAISYHEVSSYSVSATPEERAGAAPEPAPVTETERHIITEPLPTSQDSAPVLEETTYVHRQEGYRVADSEETDRVSGPSAADVVGLSAAALGAAGLGYSAAEAVGAQEEPASEPVVAASPEPVVSPMPEPAAAHAPETPPVEAPYAPSSELPRAQTDVTDAWAPDSIAPTADVAYTGSSPSYIALPVDAPASVPAEPDRASEPYAMAGAAPVAEAALEPEIPVYLTPEEPTPVYAPAPEPPAESYVPPVPDVYSAAAPQPETYRPSWEEPTAPATPAPAKPETLAELAEAGSAAAGGALAAGALSDQAHGPSEPATPAAPKMKRIRVKHRIVVEGQVVREETVEREVPADMDMAVAVRQIQAELEQSSAATPDEIARIANLTADEEVEVRRHVEGLGQ
jgi:TM2 domain-containing membrane protein YozV